MVWPTLGSRKAKEQNRTDTLTIRLGAGVKALKASTKENIKVLSASIGLSC